TAALHPAPGTPPFAAPHAARRPSPVHRTAHAHYAAAKNFHPSHPAFALSSAPRRSPTLSRSLSFPPESAACQTHTPAPSSCHGSPVPPPAPALRNPAPP